MLALVSSAADQLGTSGDATVTVHAIDGMPGIGKTALAILDQLDTLQVGDGTPPGLDRDTPSPRTSRTPAVEADRPRAAPTPELAGRGL